MVGLSQWDCGYPTALEASARDNPGRLSQASTFGCFLTRLLALQWYNSLAESPEWRRLLLTRYREHSCMGIWPKMNPEPLLLRSDPRRTEALDLREMGIVRDHATSEAKRRGGNHTVRHGKIAIDALQKPSLARQLGIELHHFQASVLKGPELGQRLSTARFLTDCVHHFCNYDGRENSSPFLAECGQLRSSPGKNCLVLRSDVSEEEFRVQDLLQSLSSRDSPSTFNRRSSVVFFEREPPSSSRLGTGRMSIESPRSSMMSRLPSLML